MRPGLRRITRFSALAVALATAVFAHRKTSPSVLPEITVMRAPDGGIQPQTALDSRGVLHMIYFKGDPPQGTSSTCALSQARNISRRRFV